MKCEKNKNDDDDDKNIFLRFSRTFILSTQLIKAV